jgi:peptidoglycan/LPS O-acetylase OafA/YrhL
MLWFIQTLPLYFVVTRLLNRLPALALVALAAVVTVARPSTGFAPLDNFCQYYVYFVLGYCGAQHIFAYADLVAAHKRMVAGLLLAWVALNAWAVNAGWTTSAAGALVFGLLGIAAIVACSRLVADVQGLGVLRFLGANSIVVYLGFFIPLHAVTAAYAATGWTFNIHMVATVIVALSIAAPVLLFVATRNTGLRLLFARPAWAHLVAPRSRVPAAA